MVGVSKGVRIQDTDTFEARLSGEARRMVTESGFDCVTDLVTGDEKKALTARYVGEHNKCGMRVRLLASEIYLTKCCDNTGRKIEKKRERGTDIGSGDLGEITGHKMLMKIFVLFPNNYPKLGCFVKKI